MAELNLTEAFSKFHARLVNPQWAVSAIAADGSLVISCWQHKLSCPEKGLLPYTDCISRWPARKMPGKALLVKHLHQAHEEKLPVRLVVVSTRDVDVVDSGGDASRIRKEFDIKPQMIGYVTSFDGDAYVIDYRKQEAVVPHTSK